VILYDKLNKKLINNLRSDSMNLAGFNAKKAREKAIAAGKYKEWTYDDVIEAIDKKAEDGKMELSVDPGYISTETKKRLEKEDFKVHLTHSVFHPGMPWFWVWWDGHK